MCKPARMISICMTTLFMLIAISSHADDFVNFNTRAGATTIAPGYKFDSTKTKLVEAAEKIYEMGSDVIKIEMSERVDDSDNYALPGISGRGIDSLKKLAELDPSFKTVFDMPFKYYVIWVYPLSISGSVYNNYWHNGYSTAEATSEYNELKELCSYLLSQYNNSGKTFIFGFWEGDNSLRLSSGDPSYGYSDPGNKVIASWMQTRITGMQDWINNRQNAVEDAMSQTSHTNVATYNYLEVNLVLQTQWQQSPPYITVKDNVMSGIANVDFVSYSCWDCTSVDCSVYSNFSNWFSWSLNEIKSKTTGKLTGPFANNIFIGEHGFNLYDASGNPVACHTEDEKSARAEDVIQIASNFGAPFVLFWQMYDNPTSGIYAGNWLINTSNQKTATYNMHKDFLKKAHTLKNATRFWLQRNPTDAEFLSFADSYSSYQTSSKIDTFINSTEYSNLVSNAQYLNLLFSQLLRISSASTDSDYQTYLSQLNAHTKTRLQILNVMLDSARFKTACHNIDFVKMLFLNSLQRDNISVSSSEFQGVVSRLEGGEKRSDIWREFLNSDEFEEKELDIRNINEKGSQSILKKYFISYTPTSTGTAWILYN